MTSTLTLQIDIAGQSGHGSRPHEIKVHAIKKAFEVLDVIADAVPEVYVTKIQAGNPDTPNQFPGNCSIEVTIPSGNKQEQTSYNLEEALQSIPEATIVNTSRRVG